MKTPITFILLALCAIFFPRPAHPQDTKRENEKVIYLDENGQPTKKKKAFALEQILFFGDTTWEINFYRMYGHLIKSFQSSDPDGRMLNGSYSSYSVLGVRDTTGHYSHGQRSGRWSFFTAKGIVAGTQLYKDGQLLWTKDTLQLQREADSMTALKGADTGMIFSKVEVESGFIGGDAAWLEYLNHHLRYPDDEVNMMIQGIVIIGFVVDRTGHVEPNSIWVDRSVDYGIDTEAIKAILGSTASWTPAMQNGRVVRSYQKQPVVFKLQVR